MYDIIELNKKLVSELRGIAKELEIKKADKLKKEELVYQILDQQAINPPKAESKPSSKKRVPAGSSSGATSKPKRKRMEKPSLFSDNPTPTEEKPEPKKDAPKKNTSDSKPPQKLPQKPKTPVQKKVEKKIKGKKLLMYLNEYESRLNWSKEELQHYQLQQLKSLLTHAYNNTSYYRKVWTNAGITNITGNGI
mgnify:CR=1 FL=1